MQNLKQKLFKSLNTCYPSPHESLEGKDLWVGTSFYGTAAVPAALFLHKTFFHGRVSLSLSFFFLRVYPFIGQRTRACERERAQAGRAAGQGRIRLPAEQGAQRGIMTGAEGRRTTD